LPPEQYTQQFGPQPTFDSPQPFIHQPFVQPIGGQVFLTNQPIEGQSSFYPNSPPPQYTQTVTQSVTPTKALENSILARDIIPSMSDCIGGAFRLFGRYCGFYVLWSLLSLLAMGGMIALIVVGAENGMKPVIYSMSQVAFSLIMLPYCAGLYYATLQVIRSDTAVMSVGFWGYAFSPLIFIHLWCLQLVSSVFICLGLLLFIFPGIYLAVCLSLSQLMFLEFGKHGLGVVECINLSRAIVSRNWCWWFGFFIVIGLISIIPFMLPISMIALTLAFRDAVGLFETHDISSYGITNTL